VHVVVEGEPVRAAHELDAVAADDVEELRLALAEAAFGVRGVVAVEVRRRCSSTRRR
jgi:hypothetical protein